MEDSAKGIERVANDVGFGTAETMRRAFLRQLGVGPRPIASALPGKLEVRTTHWGYVSTLRKDSSDETEILEYVRYVRDGNLLTAAGVSAGIDMALWLVGELYGPLHARLTQKVMEYDPAPPYTAEV